LAAQEAITTTFEAPAACLLTHGLWTASQRPIANAAAAQALEDGLAVQHAHAAEADAVDLIVVGYIKKSLKTGAEKTTGEVNEPRTISASGKACTSASRAAPSRIASKARPDDATARKTIAGSRLGEGMVAIKVGSANTTRGVPTRLQAKQLDCTARSTVDGSE